jgi:hypothetical protein
MKKQLTLLFLIITVACNAQITFEHTYPTGSIVKDYLRLVKFSSSGYKYVINDTSTITLYNLNHTVYKSIAIPSSPGGFANSAAVHVFNLSEELFDLDSTDIEYLLLYTDNSFIIHSIVYDEIGNILFQKDSIQTYLGASYGGNEYFISTTLYGVKMIIGNNFNGSASVYSLPGFLTCQECSNGIINSVVELNRNSQNGITNLYPNPTDGQTTIEYNLPQGVSKADLVVYDMRGIEIKRYKVTNAFNSIIINADELAAGTYYYQMQAPSGFYAGKKMIVIK